MTTVLDLRIYGRYPANCSPSDAREIKAVIQKNIRQRQEMPRDEYPPLPWTMADLPGTVWRNAHIYSLVTIESIRENRFGLPGPDPNPWINSLFAIRRDTLP